MKQRIIINERQVKWISKLLEQNSSDDSILRAYSFDWDDNIVSMPTMIRMLKYENGEWKPKMVSTEEFSKVRNDKDYKLDDDAFYNFREEKEFIKDLKKAIEDKSFAPSFNKFKEALIYANPISIITARGHQPITLRKGMDLVISRTFDENELSNMLSNIQSSYPETKYLTPDKVLEIYLDDIDYHPVSSVEFADRFGLEHGSAINPEKNKKIAFRDYVEKVIEGADKMVNSKYNKLSVGFSDDDLGNVNAMVDYIKDELQHEFPEMSFIVYDTSEGGYGKIIIKKR
ncbi:hypothetical protein N9322_00120 [bacterium]|jgi:hypothetical protein|nr:hypothetical protein [bacterium]|tara:strand:+ start:1257 stop:2117 length:861 start_codon:yes stop_codon:yes gene_type:complete